MKTKLFIREGSAVVTHGDLFFNFDKFSPISFVEIAVLGCIGKGIVNYLKQKEIGCPFENIHARLSNDTIKLSCRCDNSFREDFQALVNGCFVTERLAFKKEINFL